MQQTIRIEIVSAHEAVFSGEAKMVFAPSVMGELGIAPRHSPLLAELSPGEVRVIDVNDNESSLYVSGGILEVQPGVVTILSDTAERADHLDEARAKKAIDKAKKRIYTESGNINYKAMETELAEAEARLLVVKRFRRKRGTQS